MRRFKMKSRKIRIKAIVNYWLMVLLFILSNFLTFACNARPPNDHGVPAFRSTNVPDISFPLILAVYNRKEGTAREKWEGVGVHSSAGGIPPVDGRRGRNLLMVAGSSPVHCQSKCGHCTPCTPVRVRISPSVIMSANEYYPEAWRCMCRTKIYMP